MPRPNGNAAVRLDPSRPRVVSHRSHRCIRIADGVVLALGDELAMMQYWDALGRGEAYCVEANKGAAA